MVIKDGKFLYDTERKLVSLRVDELIDNSIKGDFDFNHLKSIHKFLFQDIYKCSKYSFGEGYYYGI